MGKDIIFLLVATLLTISVWVTFEVVGLTKKQNIPPEVEKAAEEIVPNLDISILEKT